MNLEYEKVFIDNFYLSDEYLSFCEKITGLKVKKVFNNINVLKNKNIVFHAYNKKEKEFMQKNKIHYRSIELKENKGKDSSFIEYPIWIYKPYTQAYKSFDKTFKKYIKRAENQNYKVKIIRKYNVEIIDEVYKLYLAHMKRLNGFVFSKSFFEFYLKSKSSLLFIIKNKDELAGYSFCFENKDNLYTSIGAGSEKYFSKYINYKLYHEKIKYACENKLNIHMGIGTKGSGYNEFKKRTGAVSLKCTSFPNDDKIIRLSSRFTKLKIVGFIFKIISKIFPKKIVFKLMPFT
jgi:hypothetical protein